MSERLDKFQFQDCLKVILLNIVSLTSASVLLLVSLNAPTSTPLDVSTLTTSFQLITFNFTGVNRITLNASTYYVIIFNYMNGNASNNPKIGRGTTNLAGERSFSNNNSSWNSQNTVNEIFYVYGDNTGFASTHAQVIAKGGKTIIKSRVIIQ